MDNPIIDRISRPSVSELRKQFGPAAVAFGLWLRLAIAGAATVVAGLFLVFDDPSRPLFTLALVLGGGVLAATAWRRAVRILDAVDDETPTETSLPSRERVVSGARRIEPSAT
jgi:hypothetical protein